MPATPAEPATPVVLAHGLLGLLIGLGEVRLGPLRAGYFLGIDRAIAARGHPVLAPLVHPTGGIAARAAMLKAQLLRGLDDLDRRGRLPADGKCVLFGHSMGGLDCRHMLAHLGMADRVRALVTVATPHRGSPVADWAARHIERQLSLTAQLARFGFDLHATRDLTADACRRFNQRTPDAPGVRYFSVSAGRPGAEVSPLLRWSERIVAAAEGLNDGLVSVASAQWGTHWETWPVDHFHTINRRVVLGREALHGEDIAPRWAGLLDRLAAEGLVEGPAARSGVRLSAAQNGAESANPVAGAALESGVVA